MNATLQGAEKQIAWAESIRAKAIEQIDADLADSSQGWDASEIAEFQTGREILEQIDQSSWWIENRSSDGIQLAVKAAKDSARNFISGASEANDRIRIVKDAAARVQ